MTSARSSPQSSPFHRSCETGAAGYSKKRKRNVWIKQYHDRRWFLTTAAMSMAAFRFGMVSRANAGQARTVRLSNEGNFPSLDDATGWLNSQQLTPAGLRGKVVLVNFWTYTCVNWRRTLPYVRAWSQKNKDHGLVVIGVHTPEFSFEHNVNNIRWSLKDMKIEYPVAVDSNYAIWRAFNNEYWPASYFIDAKGRIRHHQFGEGEYLEGEAVIQQLLTEAGSDGFSRESATVRPHGLEVAADLGTLRSPETYVGYQQTQNFASSPWRRMGQAGYLQFPSAIRPQLLGACRQLDGGERGRCTQSE
jgi:thiol-disulfide isomerase/thioredoxin